MCYPKYASDGNSAEEMRAQGSSEEEQQNPEGAKPKNGLEVPWEDGKQGTEGENGSKHPRNRKQDGWFTGTVDSGAAAGQDV